MDADEYAAAGQYFMNQYFMDQKGKRRLSPGENIRQSFPNFHQNSLNR